LNVLQAVAEKDLGNVAYKKKDFETAMKHYNKAVDLDSTNIIFRNNRAGCLYFRLRYLHFTQWLYSLHVFSYRRFWVACFLSLWDFYMRFPFCRMDCDIYCIKSKRSIAVSDSPHRYGNSHAIWDHTVLPATQQRWHSRLTPSRSWYSIKRPRKDARLSWPNAVRIEERSTFASFLSMYYSQIMLLYSVWTIENLTELLAVIYMQINSILYF